MREDKRRRIAQKPSTSTPRWPTASAEQGLPRTARPVLQHLPQPLPSAAQGHLRRTRQPPRAGQQDHAGAIAKRCRPISRPRSGPKKPCTASITRCRRKNGCRFLKCWTFTAFASSRQRHSQLLSPGKPCTPCTSPFPGKVQRLHRHSKSNGYKVCTPRCLAMARRSRCRFRTRTPPYRRNRRGQPLDVQSGDESIDRAQQRTHRWLQPPELQVASGDAIEFLEHVRWIFPDEVCVFTPGPHPRCCRKAPPRWILPHRRAHRHRSPLHCRQINHELAPLAHAR